MWRKWIIEELPLLKWMQPILNCSKFRYLLFLRLMDKPQLLVMHHFYYFISSMETFYPELRITIPNTGVDPLLAGLDLSSSSSTEPQHFNVPTIHLIFSFTKPRIYSELVVKDKYIFYLELCAILYH